MKEKYAERRGVLADARREVPIKRQFFSRQKHLEQIWLPNNERSLNSLEFITTFGLKS